MSYALRRARANASSDESDDERDHQYKRARNALPVDLLPGAVFTIIGIDSWGQDTLQFDEADAPLDLRDRQILALHFSEAAWMEYYSYNSDRVRKFKRCKFPFLAISNHVFWIGRCSRRFDCQPVQRRDASRDEFVRLFGAVYKGRNAQQKRSLVLQQLQRSQTSHEEVRFVESSAYCGHSLEAVLVPKPRLARKVGNIRGLSNWRIGFVSIRTRSARPALKIRTLRCLRKFPLKFRPKKEMLTKCAHAESLRLVEYGPLHGVW